MIKISQLKARASILAITSTLSVFSANVKRSMQPLVISISVSMSINNNCYAADSTQTVEGAQKFLSMVLMDKKYDSGSVEAAVKETADKNHYSAYIDGSAKITESKVISRCKSTLKYDYTGVDIVVGRERISLVDIRPELKKGGQPDGFMWGELIEARIDADKVIMTFKEGFKSKVYLGGENLAKRVVYAMEFLRIHCDESADTGF